MTWKKEDEGKKKNIYKKKENGRGDKLRNYKLFIAYFLVCNIPDTFRLSSDLGPKETDILQRNVGVSCAAFMNSLIHGRKTRYRQKPLLPRI